MNRIVGCCLGLFFSVGLVIFIPSNAHATPPRSIHVNDIPIALNKTHMFLLRTVFDNFGSHYIDNATRYLISQNLETNAVEGHWLMGRTNLETIEECAPDCLKVEHGPSVNAFKVLASLAATPILVYPALQWNSAPLETNESDLYPTIGEHYHINEKGIFFENEFKETKDVIFSTSELIEILERNLNRTFQLMPKYGKGKDDVFIDEPDSYAKNFEGCAVGSPNHSVEGKILVLLSCESDEFVGYYQIYLTMKDPDIDG